MRFRVMSENAETCQKNRSGADALDDQWGGHRWGVKNDHFSMIWGYFDPQ